MGQSHWNSSFIGLDDVPGVSIFMVNACQTAKEMISNWIYGCPFCRLVMCYDFRRVSAVIQYAELNESYEWLSVLYVVAFG